MKTHLILLFVCLVTSSAIASEAQALELARKVEAFALKYKDEVKSYHDSGGRLTDEFDPFFELLLYECELLVPENKQERDFKEISLEDRMLSVRLIRARTSIIMMAAASVLSDSNNYSDTNALLADWSGVFVAVNEYEQSVLKRAMEN